MEEFHLNRQNIPRDGTVGRLPPKVPLANPYVPFQLENPPKYEIRQGIIRGTLFPGLDLPFKGIVNKCKLPITPLTEMQAMAFAIQELALYLDTHRDDEEALMLYQTYQQMYDECKRKYNRERSPINHFVPTKGPYRWLDDPWPWEYAKNKEA